MTLHMIHRRIVIHACVKYRKQIFIGVGDIHPDGQISNRRTEPKSLSPTKFVFLMGDNKLIVVNMHKFNSKLTKLEIAKL